jgi:hypothetical protein
LGIVAPTTKAKLKASITVVLGARPLPQSAKSVPTVKENEMEMTDVDPNLKAELYESVEMGVRWLSYYFTEWYDLVDPETLDINRMGKDILSQVFDGQGGYREAVRILKAEEGPRPHLGRDQGFNSETLGDGSILTELWKVEIKRHTLKGLYE